MKKVQKQLLFLPVLCLSMAIGGCGKKETDKTDAADMTKNGAELYAYLSE